jgi:plastocyanin
VGALLVLAAVGVGTALAADHAVAISGSAFSPATVTVAVGDTVTWTNSDQISHTATADTGQFDTGTIGNGASVTITFPDAGSFPYHCTIHVQMTGTITVAAAAPAPPTAAPTNPPTDAGVGQTTAPLPALIGAVLVIGGAGFIGLLMARRRFAQGD